jgi:hypothetical protein
MTRSQKAAQIKEIAENMIAAGTEYKGAMRRIAQLAAELANGNDDETEEEKPTSKAASRPGGTPPDKVASRSAPEVVAMLDQVFGTGVKQTYGVVDINPCEQVFGVPVPRN